LRLRRDVRVDRRRATVHALKPAAVDAAVVVESQAWRLLRALAARARTGEPVVSPCGVRVEADGGVAEVAPGEGWLDLYPDGPPWFRPRTRLSPAVERMLDLYLPLCIGAGSADLVVGHVAQSLDGQIATASGASCFITGQQDLVHTHCLRALFDAVVVGRATVACDDPRLTTRLVPGPNPTRVVVDPGRRSPLDRRVFSDGLAPTLIVCAGGHPAPPATAPNVELVELASRESVFPPALILDELRARGLRRIFVEGGGMTVSTFLAARLLGRLHVTVSPLFLGRGRPGVTLPGIDSLDQAWRPGVRRFSLGDDTLFDCQFS
jgi:diaminohydroxyphosphoribosylaminopyrimidine deaminase/5-amino-6-(5-phosphoribosylamino)uracil reductase